MVWYPLGRPVGTTIYPGLQFTAVWINRYLLPNWSLNDVCCYIPAWFGAVATVITGMIAYECSIPANSTGSLLGFVMDIMTGKKAEIVVKQRPMIFGFWSPALQCGLFAMAMMAIVPAHLMRSVGGGFDNESVAISAMVLTFYCWVRSLRANDPYSPWFGILTGLSYFYMVAAWGGYVFVLNMIGVHAALLVGLGRFSTKVWASYSLFYLVGTLLAIQIPVVGWTPLKSLEQLGPAAVFGGYQLLQVCEILRKRNKLDRKEAWKLRTQVFAAATALVVVATMALAPKGYFGPISARVRGLFVQHTKTGNPLVDSVAEHQPASSRAYFTYLHHVCSLAPIGYLIVFFKLSDASSFLITWGTFAYFFSHKMVRLILLTAPIGTVLAGIAAGRLFAWCVKQWWETDDASMDDSESSAATNGAKTKETKKKKGSAKQKAAAAKSNTSFDGLASLQDAVDTALKTKEGVLVKRTAALVFFVLGYILGGSFVSYSWRLSEDLANPTIIMKARLRDGRIIKVDDYREAYWWLRDNTPKDSRCLSWWDYGALK